MHGRINRERIENIRALAEKGLILSEIAQSLGISRQTVMHYEKRYGIQIRRDPKAVWRQSKNRSWSETEIDDLCAYYRDGTVPLAEIAQSLGRTQKAVYSKIVALKQQGELSGVRRRQAPHLWTEDDVDYLISAYQDRTVNLEEVAEVLECSVKVVLAKINELRSLGVIENRQLLAYTNAELRFLIANYQTMTPEEIGQELGRTATAIKNKASRLGIARYPRDSERVDKIRKLAEEGLILSEVARKIGVDIATIRHYEKTYGIVIQREPLEAKQERYQKWMRTIFMKDKNRRRNHLNERYGNRR